MEKSLRKSGIDVIGEVPWGTHFCQFYQTKQDLIDILVPYFKAGLENNEFCMWITSEPLEVEEAKKALREVVPGIDIYIEKGQLEILPYDHWYVKEGIFDSQKVLNCCFEKLNRALADGYDGLRLSGNTFWMEKKDWNSFVNYEEEIDSISGNYSMIALCTYSLEKCSATEVIDVVTNHQFTLIKKENKWTQIESFRRKLEVETVFQSTQYWRSTFDSIPDLVAILDNEYRIVRANRAMAERLGLSPEKCKGLNCYRVMHGIDEPPSFCPHRQLLNDGLEHTVEICEDCLGGYFIVSVSPLYDSEGNVIGSVHVARDINERKKAEFKLKETLDNLEKLIEERTSEVEKAYNSLKENERSLYEAQKMAHLGNWDWNIVTNELYWSDEVYHIFGCSPQEVWTTYDSFLKYVHPEDRDYVNKAVKEVLNGKNYNITHRIILTNGEVRVLQNHAEVIFNEEKIPFRIRGTVQDITEHKKTEKALKLANEYNRSLIEASIDPLVTIGPDGKITDVNKATELVTGFSRCELIGTDFSDYFTEPEKAREGYQRVFKEGFVLDYELEIQHKEGYVTPVLYNASVYKKEDGEVIGVFAAARDITERKKAELLLKLKLDELACSNAELEQFAYVSSHDLQEPLRMIASYLQLLQRKYQGKLDDKADKYIYFAVDGASRMQNLINDLLEFSRVTTKAREFEPTDCNSILKQVVFDLEVSIKENEADVSYDSLPVVMADSSQLAQVFQNLVSNAIKFRSDKSPEIKISAKKNDNKWLFSVQDNGIGIDPKFSERIFEVFKRLNKREEYPGTGIGLSICKKIIERHGGHIWVESELETGSIFYFTLPII